MLKIVVTQKHIRRGRHQSAYHCPIALALGNKEYENHVDDASVNTKFVRYNGGIYEVSEEMRAWIQQFDGKRAVAPATFTLEQMEDNHDTRGW